MVTSRCLTWIAVSIYSVLVAACGGGGGGDATGSADSGTGQAQRLLPAGPWSDPRNGGSSSGIAVWVPDRDTGSWSPAPDGTAVEITRIDAPGASLERGTTLGGIWKPSLAATPPGPALRVTATVALGDGSTRRMRSLYATEHTDISAGSEALVAWLEPQVVDPTVRARLSANEVAQLQELGTLATDAMLHRAVTIDAAVESGRDVIVNLSRLPEYLTLALRDETDATTDADWLDLVANREGDRIGVHSRVSTTLQQAASALATDHWESVTLNGVQRDEGGLVRADALRLIAGTRVSPFIQREGHGLYWDDSALSILSTGVKAVAYQLASAVPVLAFPLQRQGSLWSERVPLGDGDIDLDGDSKNDRMGVEAFVDALGVEDLRVGNRSMRALHVRRNMTLTLQLSSDKGASSLFALRIDGWHVPGIGLVYATRQLVFVSAEGQTDYAAAIDEVESGSSNGFSMDAAARLYTQADPVGALLPDPRGDRVFALPLVAGLGGLHLRSLALAGAAWTATPVLDVNGVGLVNSRVGVDGRSLYLNLGYRDDSGAGHQGLWRFDVVSAQMLALGELPLITYDDPVGGYSSVGWPLSLSAFAPDPIRPEAPLTLSNANGYSTLSMIGRADGSPTVVPLLDSGIAGRGALSDTDGQVLNVGTPGEPTPIASDDGAWLYFSAFTQPNGRTGNNLRSVYRWNIGGAANPDPVIASRTLVGQVGGALVARGLSADNLDARLSLVDPARRTVLAELDLRSRYPDLVTEPVCTTTSWKAVFCHAVSTSGGRRAIWLDAQLQVQRTALLRMVGNYGATLLPLRDGSVAVLDTTGPNVESALPLLWREDPRLHQSN